MWVAGLGGAWGTSRSDTLIIPSHSASGQQHEAEAHSIIDVHLDREHKGSPKKQKNREILGMGVGLPSDRQCCHINNGTGTEAAAAAIRSFLTVFEGLKMNYVRWS